MRIESRRSARGITAVVVMALFVGATAFSASAAVTPASGPRPPGPGDPPLDLPQLGYVSSEFFVDGNARSYHDASPLTVDGAWSVEADPIAGPFKTRIQVLKPEDPARFNGTVYVEWLNVSAGFDSQPDWTFAHVEMARQGAAYVGVTAQAVGLNAAVAAHPDRYGPAGANLVHPGDSYSYDIYSQVGQALRADAETIFGGAYPVQRLIADGESQSAGRMVTYVDAFARTGVYDGYMIHSRGANGAALRQAPLGPITVPPSTLIRTDLTQPVFTFQSETDSRLPRQADSAWFRWWEVPGTSHIDASLLKLSGLDYGTSPDFAAALFDTMVHPYSGPFGAVGDCALGINAGPHYWVIQAAFHHLNAWVTDGTPPPFGPRMATSDGTGAGALVLDANGNATGGIRTPHLDVPIATLRGTGNSPAVPGPLNFCALFGTTFSFTPEKLAQLYKNHGAFVSQWVKSVNAATAAGFILPADAEFVKGSAATSQIGK